MSKRALTVGVLTAGLSAGLVAGAISPAAAQGNPVGGQGNVYYLSGAGSAGGVAQKVMAFGNPGDEVYFGDWDGDGVDTPMVNRNAVFFVADQDGKTTDVFAYGNPGDPVLIGDWNGDGVDSIAVRRDNLFLVKNDNKKSGTADSQFYFGDPGDRVLVGDWDGKGGDTLMVYRADTSFHVANDNTSGKTDYTFFYGNPGDTVLAGDWANPETGESGNGADQIAVRRDGNHYFLSKELGKDVDLSKAMRDLRYGEATDTVFATSLPTEVLDENGKAYPNNQRPQTYAADVPAVHKAGDPILVWDADATDGFAQAKDSITQAVLTYKGGEPVTQMPGTKQVYRGGEGVVTADGKAVKYVAVGGTTGDNAVDLSTAEGWAADGASTTSGTIAKYKAGEPVLNADGTFVWVKVGADGGGAGEPVVGNWAIQVWTASATPTSWEKTLPAGDANKVAVKAGDQVVRRAGEQAVLVKGSPAVYGTAVLAGTNGQKAGDAVVTHGMGDVMFNPDGTVARNADGTVRTHAVAVTSTTETYKAGAPILHRKGEIKTGYLYDADGADDAPGGGDDHTWTPTSITNDELANLYQTRPATDVARTTEKLVSELDADADIEPVWYDGTEQYVTTAQSPLSNFAGGETAAGNKKGDVVFDKDGKPVMINTVIKGDGLGVRRNFG
ncbi:hypothetical protein OF117_04330 [Geodermatophilus sp. YIM 151500]|uniref:hypothetical protein n=1 Tax=Geodermatophilus sp. YIM 151500 TaxID=2984531 RepID=UPI0021E494FB|nr:hypothetical protein [Geodermatophilus sp. YIM 151500]MCV2488582.1 hypothetical protein [Geodermatophilus sp. YIM 151500]